MRITTSLLGLIGLLALAGCASGPPRILPGQPGFEPGSPVSYWVWHDGASWHLRATTAGLPHRFHGVVLPLGGRIADVTPTRVEWGDRIRMGPRGIEFDFQTQGGTDGFDWHVTSGCNRFELFIDGVAEPGRVHLGGGDNRPARIPFDRCRP